MKSYLYGTTVNGLPVFDNSSYAKGEFALYEGKRWCIVLDKEKRNRSLEQNNYYYGCVLESVYLFLRGCGDETDKAQLHSMIANKFLQYEYVGYGGQILGFQTKSTADLSTDEFTKFIEDVRKWAAETLAIDIADPNKNDRSKPKYTVTL